MSLEQLSQDPFDADAFVDQLAWQVGFSNKFEPMLLHGAFCQTIRQLTEYERSQDQRARILENECMDEEAKQRKKVRNLVQANQSAFENFQELDERVNFVATKVVHLGDQLESVNVPRARNADALSLMRCLDIYLKQENDGADEENMPFDKLSHEAELIQKLSIIAHDLPTDTAQFVQAKEKVTRAYQNIERQLTEHFLAAYSHNQVERMKLVCDQLRHFRGYGEAIKRFIAASLKPVVNNPMCIDMAEELCVTANDIIYQVFFNAESVMTRLLTNLYTSIFAEHLRTELDPSGSTDVYLTRLSALYSQLCQLTSKLAERVKVGSDKTLLSKLMKTIFSSHLQSYPQKELAHLREKSSLTLARFYESQGHVKRQLQAGGISDLRREVQAKIHFNIMPDQGEYSGKDFLSQQVAISVLQEFKLAFVRCKALIVADELPKFAAEIFAILVQVICTEFIDYAIELGLYYCPMADSRGVPPQLQFFSVVSDASAIVHLFEKLFSDSLWPIVNRTGFQAGCRATKQDWTVKFETKLDLGIERCLAAICGHVRYLLTTEQKRTDFKPDTDVSMVHTHACLLVVNYMRSITSTLKQQLDGQNLTSVLYELGVRFHRLVYEHLLQFQYNSMGAMLAICDVNEYRSFIKELNCELVVRLFDVLHSLCNLLLVPSENLSQVCVGEPLNQLDKATVESFIQLRADYKQDKKISSLFGY